MTLSADAIQPLTLHDNELLLAQADTSAPEGSATISDAGSAVGAGAAEATPFELSALPLAAGAGLGPVAGALGLGAVAVNNNAGAGAAAKTYTFAITKAADNQGAVAHAFAELVHRAAAQYSWGLRHLHAARLHATATGDASAGAGGVC